MCDMWPDENLLVDRVLEDSNTGQELEIMILDLPQLHQPYTTPGQEFARALSEVEDT